MAETELVVCALVRFDLCAQSEVLLVSISLCMRALSICQGVMLPLPERVLGTIYKVRLVKIFCERYMDTWMYRGR